jgi:hypothetical protein
VASKAYAEPSRVEAVEGDVVVDGPGGVAVTLTPEAAIETSERLLAKGVEAAGQRRLKGERAGSGDKNA